MFKKLFLFDCLTKQHPIICQKIAKANYDFLIRQKSESFDTKSTLYFDGKPSVLV